jgi:hypothetical protein
MSRAGEVDSLVTLLQAATREAGKGGSGLPHMSEVAEHFIREVGGVEAFARLLYQEFINSPRGSIARQRLLQTLCAAWRFGNDSNRKPQELGDLTEDDLDREIAAKLAQAQASIAHTQHGEVPNAP